MHKPFTNQSVYAILGFLNEKEMSGYDIRKAALDSIGYFWHESEGHLYPTLKRMVTAGLISEASTTNRTQRPRKQYCITKKGQDRLKEWLQTPVQEGRVRNPLLLKLFFSKEVSDDIIRQHLERELFKRKEQMLIYKHIESEISQLNKSKQQQKLWKMTLSYGLKMTQAWIDWLEESLDIVTS